MAGLDQLAVYSPMAVARLVGVEDLADRRLRLGPRVGVLEAGLVVEERRTCQPGRGEQIAEPMLCLEGDDSLNLQDRRCCFLKACNFPR